VKAANASMALPLSPSWPSFRPNFANFQLLACNSVQIFLVPDSSESDFLLLHKIYQARSFNASPLQRKPRPVSMTKGSFYPSAASKLDPPLSDSDPAPFELPRSQLSLVFSFREELRRGPGDDAFTLLLLLSAFLSTQ